VVEKGHGRVETRQTAVYGAEGVSGIDLFGAATLLVTVREREVAKTGKTSLETAFHLGTPAPREHDAAGWAALVRSHWGIENGNHWRRDACLFEDKTPGGNPFVLGNLAVARAALLFYNANTRIGNINISVQGNQNGTNNTFQWLMSKNTFK